MEQLGFLLEEYYRRHPALRGRETTWWSLDEIQLVPGWERSCAGFVRRVMDTERVEFARHRGEEPAKSARSWRAAERSLVEKRFREYLTAGGFPETQGLPTQLRIELLQGYVDTVLFRDVVERYGVQQVAALRWIVRHCLRNPAGSFSAHRMYRDLKSHGDGVAKGAVHAMLGHLFDAFLLGAVPVATESERQRNSNPRKLYPADTGLIRAFNASARAGANTGHALETAMFNELQRRGADVCYVKAGDGAEVDFLARQAGAAGELIQVCAAPSHTETRARELHGLCSAAATFPRVAQRLLVLDCDAVAPAATPA